LVGYWVERDCRKAIEWRVGKEVSAEKSIVSFRGFDSHLKGTAIGKFAKGDFEVRMWSVGARFAEYFGTWNGRAQSESVGEEFVGFALWVAFSPSHASEYRVVDTGEVFPSANGIIPLIAFDESKRFLHLPRFEGEWFRDVEFVNDEIAVGKQVVVGSEDERFVGWVRMDAFSEVHAKGFDSGRFVRVYDSALKGFFGDIEERIELQRGHLQHVRLVGETIAGNAIRGENIREI
jgi:hypothetical protein